MVADGREGRKRADGKGNRVTGKDGEDVLQLRPWVCLRCVIRKVFGTKTSMPFYFTLLINGLFVITVDLRLKLYSLRRMNAANYTVQ